MSSAILYLAIVAIWACVLIPRWLRRDSARGSAHAFATVTSGGQVAGDFASDHDDAFHAPDVPGGAPRAADGPERHISPGRAASRRDIAASSVEDTAADPPEDAAEDTAGQDTAGQDTAGQDGTPPPPLTAEESRQRMLAARRRLLGMLLALEGAAIALAVLGLAALWVVIPPSVMLSGYMLLLREAAHADAERARRDREAASAHARARERARAQARARAEQRAGRHAGASGPAGAAGVASAPGAADSGAGHEDAGPGRDFAPGLAGKYTPSNAEVIPISERAGEDYYDQENKLRAVGD